jgi:hypothetical protein
VRACPTGARHFGDLGDADSPVSKLVAERGGYDLLPQAGYKPVNKYLPPRPRRMQPETAKPASLQDAPAYAATLAERLFAWADQKLTR